MLNPRGARATYICVPCRHTAKLRFGGNCPRCGNELRNMGTRWRPPRRRNDAAWKRIGAGQVNTEPVKPATYRGQRPTPPYPFTSPGPYQTTRLVTFQRADKDMAEALRQVRIGTLTERWVRTQKAHVRAAVAGHEHTPDRIRHALLRDKDPKVRARAVTALAEPVAELTLVRLRRDTDPAVRAALASRPDATARVLARLAEDRDQTVRAAAAANPNTRLTSLLKVSLGMVPPDRLPELVARAGVGETRVVEALMRHLHTEQPALPATDALRLARAAVVPT